MASQSMVGFVREWPPLLSLPSGFSIFRMILPHTMRRGSEKLEWAGEGGLHKEKSIFQMKRLERRSVSARE